MTYPGGKGALYQWLINHIPPHQTFISTHLGNCAVMRFKRPARQNIGIDLDAEVIEMWQQRAAVTTTNGDTAAPPYMAVAAAPDTIAIYGGASCAGVMSTTTTYDDDAGVTAIYGGARYQFISADAVAWLDSYPWTGSEFVYADPPYLFETRKQKDRAIYRHEYRYSDHMALLDVLFKLPCDVMVSGYRSELYDDMLRGWHSDTIEAMTRGGTMATEVIWMNYPPPKHLHDYRYLGGNYRERERIKKKKNRWAQRWAGMDRLERLAILAAIEEAA